jgi:hypothetical protein
MRPLQTSFFRVTGAVVGPSGYPLTIKASESGLGRLKRPITLIEPKNGAL